MKPVPDWERIIDLVGRGREIPSDQLNAWLQRECGEDEALRAEAASLLEAADRSAGFLDDLIMQLLTPVVTQLMSDRVARMIRSWSGRTIGSYEVGELIGIGGTAIVFLARDTRHDRRVAIKVLRPELASAIGSERFLKEIAVTARLEHPHILPLLDSGEAEGSLYYVLPYVEGETLRERLDREGPFGLDEALEIITEIADALDHAHRHGVVHRDIKPGNILLRDDHARVADFGVADVMMEVDDGENIPAGARRVMGTPDYMSPEQITGNQPLDGRSDVYSLGCLAFELLTGRPPFAAADRASLMRCHAEAEPLSLRGLRLDLPAEADAAVARALAKFPGERYASAGAFASALERSAARRHPSARKRISAGAAVALGVVVVGLWATNARRGPDVTITGWTSATPAVEPGAAGHLLWVDDDREGNAEESDHLSRMGYEITWATSTENALQLYDAREFDLVVSDLGRMEDGEYNDDAGLDLLEALGESDPDVTIVFFTSARAVKASADSIISAGAAGITFRSAELYDLVRHPPDGARRETEP